MTALPSAFISSKVVVFTSADKIHYTSSRDKIHRQEIKYIVKRVQQESGTVGPGVDVETEKVKECTTEAHMVV